MKLSIKKFQELQDITLSDLDETAKSIEFVKCLLNKNDKQIMKLNTNKISRLCLKYKSVLSNINENKKKLKKYIFIKGVLYRFNYDLELKPNNAGKYVEIATFSTDVIGNLHLIMATMVTPLKLTWKGFKAKEHEHKKISEDMLSMNYLDAYNSAVFFCKILKY